MLTTVGGIMIFVIAGAVLLWIVAPMLFSKKEGQPTIFQHVADDAAALRARFEADMKAIRERRGLQDDPLARLMQLHNQVKIDLTKLVQDAAAKPEVQESLKRLEDAVITAMTVLVRNLPPPPLV